ncbi:hypothetical protein CaCOL14_000740 [Colletotrichum acutatum]
MAEASRLTRSSARTRPLLGRKEIVEHRRQKLIDSYLVEDERWWLRQDSRVSQRQF